MNGVTSKARSGSSKIISRRHSRAAAAIALAAMATSLTMRGALADGPGLNAPALSISVTATDVELLVNPVTGATTIISELQGSQPVITAYSILSPSHSLIPFQQSGSKYLGTSLENNPNVYYTSSNGNSYNNWTGVKNTTLVIAEAFGAYYNKKKDYTWTNYAIPTTGYSFGNLFKGVPNGGIEDLQFEWDDPTHTTYTSPVIYSTTPMPTPTPTPTPTNTDTWQGKAADANWQTAGNWSSSAGGSSAFAGDALVFTGTTQTTPVNDFPANTSFPVITFDANAGTFTLTGNAVQAALVTNLSKHLQTINLNLNVTGNGSFQTTGSGGDITINGNLTGTSNLLKLSGAGTLTLTGNNTVGSAGGAFVVSNANLRVTSAASLTLFPIYLASTTSSTLQLCSDTPIVASGTQVVMADNSQNATATLTVDQAIGGTATNQNHSIGTLTLETSLNSYGNYYLANGHGFGLTIQRLDLEGENGQLYNTFTGAAKLTLQSLSIGTEEGELSLSQGASSATSLAGPMTAATDAELDLFGAGMYSLDATNAVSSGCYLYVNAPMVETAPNAISGANTEVVIDSTTVALSQSNSYTGSTYFDSGTLLLGNSSALGTGTIEVGGCTYIDATTPLTVANNVTISLPTPTGTVTFLGSNNLAFTGSLSLGAGTVVFNTLAHTLGLGPLVGNANLTKAGPGALALNGPATLGTGKTITLNAGTLDLNALGTSGSGNTLIINSGAIDNTSGSPIHLVGIASSAWNNDFTYGGSGDLDLGTASINLNPANGFSVTVTTNGNHALTVGGVIHDFTGGFSNAYQLTKAGNGTLILTGGETPGTTNSFTGGTSVIAGTVLVNNTTGSGLGDGPVSLSGGTLGGTGTIAGKVTAGQLGTLSPGINGSIGTLHTGAVVLANGATLSIQLNSNNLTADLLASTSSVSLGDVAYANLVLTDIGTSAMPVGKTLPIVTSTKPITGIFAGLAEGAQISVGVNTYSISYATPDEVYLTALPEPSTALGISGFGAAALLLRRRRGARI